MSANLVLSVLMVPVIRNKMTSRGSIACATAVGIGKKQKKKPKKFPAGPGEATENHFTFAAASGGWGYP